VAVSCNWDRVACRCFIAVESRISRQIEVFWGRLPTLSFIKRCAHAIVSCCRLSALPEVERAWFPFKIFEYLICGAHIIAAPLPELKDVDLRFAQGWDGELPSLLEKLKTAEDDFGRCRAERARTEAFVKRRFSVNGVSEIYGALIERVTVSRQ